MPVSWDLKKKKKRRKGWDIVVSADGKEERFPVKDARRVALTWSAEDRAALFTKLGLEALEERPSTPEEIALFGRAKTPEEVPASFGLMEPFPVPRGVTPYPHQVVAAAFLRQAGFRAIIGDSMGVGKTLSALGALSADWEKLTPAVVVAPASVLYSWRSEVGKFAPWFRPVVLDSKLSGLPRITKRSLFLVSWSSLESWLPSLLSAGLHTVIFDEVHYAKNPEARRTKASWDLSLACPFCIALSGTPMLNNYDEAYSLFRLIEPQKWGREKTWQEHFIRAPRAKTPYGYVDSPEAPSETARALKAGLARIMVRRTKAEVLTSLPEKTRIFLPIELTTSGRTAYDAAEEDTFGWARAAWREKALKAAAAVYKKAVAKRYTSGDALAHWALQYAQKTVSAPEPSDGALAKIGHLRRLTGTLKSVAAVSWIRDFLAQDSGPLVVFFEHQTVLKELSEGLTGLCRFTHIDGSVPAKERANRVNRFQSGELDVILLSPAAAEGITLTRASSMLFVERWWVPAKEEQAEDRIHRIGQKSHVTIHYLIAEGTMDSYVCELLERKKRALTQVLSSEPVEEVAFTCTKAEESSVTADLLRRIVREAPLSVADLREFFGRSG